MRLRALKSSWTWPTRPRQTIAALKEIDLDYVIPLHCSGEPFYEMAKAEMPSKLLRSYTGTRFVFGEGSGA